MRRATITACLSLAVSLLGMPAPGEAAKLFQRTFDPQSGGPACYLRIYDNRFLKQHPKLGVRIMALAYENQAANKANNFALRLSIELKKNSANYSALAFCRTKSAGFSCTLESDGGTLQLERAGKGLRLKSHRIQIEGAIGGSDLDLSAPPGKSRSLTLKAATTSQCNGAYD